MQMAVFLINTCKFSACGLTFPTLGELIQHIEESHIGSTMILSMLLISVVLSYEIIDSF